MMEQIDIKKKFYVGQKASFSKTISEYDIYCFAGICGDFNSYHINKCFSEKNRFKKQIAHGALINAFISTVLGMILPGDGTIYLSQNSNFISPAYIGDTITAKVEIIGIEEKKAKLKTEVINQDNVMIIDGEATVLLP